MSLPIPAQIQVAPKVLLDGRLALFHQAEGWLAVADLHFGYELSQRAAGRLVPLWGMTSIEQRLGELVADYRPNRLIVVGDLVHDRASIGPAEAFLNRLRQRCELVILAGNHDRQIENVIAFETRWETPDFVFQHEMGGPDRSGRIQIIGHHHPAAQVSDGAGLRLKFPAFVQQGRCWILPAFSPWAGGVAWPDDGESRIWLCSPRRVLRVDKIGATRYGPDN